MAKGTTKKPAKRRRVARPSLLSGEEITTLFARLRAERPAPESELEYADPYTLLVAVVLSAQATDAGVNKATRVLFKDAPTPERMVALGEAGVRERIKTIGLFRNKAKNVVALSEKLLAEHGGKVPQSRAELEALPGVGRKTANVVLNVAFGHKTIAVDTHIFRIANRTGLAPGKDPRAVEEALEAVVPDEFALHAHHWLILHGRYVCVARRPKCPECAIADICRYADKTEPAGDVLAQKAT
ncbi:endonuclease III [Afifella pfennigii]|uniref:endonuclease III n=1 Tax=Afifella pfennigii TaxID=209897 RepID=UPI00068B2825|nr:endonuclease III [Afifella pfennigii]